MDEFIAERYRIAEKTAVSAEHRRLLSDEAVERGAEAVEFDMIPQYGFTYQEIVKRIIKAAIGEDYGR